MHAFCQNFQSLFVRYFFIEKFIIYNILEAQRRNMYNQLNVLIENMFPLLERCPRVTGYVYIGQLDSCFKLHLPNSSLRYPDYNRICTDEGGELMKIDSDEKQQFAAKFLGLY